MRFGIGTVEDLTWKQMMDAFSCTECGRCQDACPAYATGKVLSPKLVVMGVRDHLFEEGPKALAGDYEGPLVAETAQLEEMAWDCVTCGACVEACPVNIEHIDHIVDLRRHLVMAESRFPSEAEPMLRDVERRRTRGASRRPSGRTGRRGSASACSSRATRRRRSSTGSAAPRRSTSVRRRRARSTAKLLTAAGVDFAILGPRRRAPAIPPGAWATSSSSRPTPRERRDARRGGRDEDRRQLPALLQHAVERVPRLRGPLRGHAPHRAARRAGPRRPARADGE